MSTECNAPPITLSSLRRQKLLLKFNGRPITSDAGALLLREADLRLRLTERGPRRKRFLPLANAALV
jgi:hypothetical protein